MNRVFFFIFSLLLSFSLLANSTVFVVNDQGVIRSDRVAINDKNIIKTIGKNQRLQRLTMHYSGWSLVTLDGVNGWILSENLTTESPALPNDNSSTTAEFYQKMSNNFKSEVAALTQKKSLLERENTRLSTLVADLNNKIKALSSNHEALKNTPEATSVLKISTDIDSKNLTFKDEYPTSIVDGLNDNWIYLSITLLIALLLAVFSIYNKNKRQHFDLNTIRRH
ncbi:hypothetical protein SP60_08145 [Candidatus Thioglobus autotrophicus]|uniref:SH3b domain-containing protein n=1 Tax=Candidatus Thioglobus autotrophicus TaxID=1705394 RepID=A0A0M4NIA9_9GAMM|nr:hypothetical protein [Candidatus Thioglobus autotrophicus]ALE53158.1 hypothetical protein SP60_08145 [Candidatus Thioglobus autotrophicus]WPE15790.1 hypothetical protein R5P06_04345 [Candidatus Thioglobus autotrophicus]WPE17304.1 hypothetical protein R5P05_04300 [Candidatus Thioglobus autotrophicus]